MTMIKTPKSSQVYSDAVKSSAGREASKTRSKIQGQCQGQTPILKDDQVQLFYLTSTMHLSSHGK